MLKTVIVILLIVVLGFLLEPMNNFFQTVFTGASTLLEPLFMFITGVTMVVESVFQYHYLSILIGVTILGFIFSFIFGNFKGE